MLDCLNSFINFKFFLLKNIMKYSVFYCDHLKRPNYDLNSINCNLYGKITFYSELPNAKKPGMHQLHT